MKICYLPLPWRVLCGSKVFWEKLHRVELFFTSQENPVVAEVNLVPHNQDPVAPTLYLVVQNPNLVVDIPWTCSFSMATYYANGVDRLPTDDGRGTPYHFWNETLVQKTSCPFFISLVVWWWA